MRRYKESPNETLGLCYYGFCIIVVLFFFLLLGLFMHIM